MKVCGVLVLATIVCGTAVAQSTTAPTPPKLPEQDRVLSRQIFKEFIETNSQDSDGSVTAVSLLARKELLKAGFAPEDLILAGPNDRKQNLVVRYHGKPGSKLKPILIICHEDVVEARRADWSTDPYTFVEKDGYFYGRGTQDMKDADADVVSSFVRLKREGYVPNRDIILALTADEEGGKSNGVSWLLKNRPELMRAEFVINPDGEGPTLHDGKVVDLDVEATEKTYADYRITTTNPGGHSSEPRPDNAIYELMHALLKLEATPFPVELNNVSRSELEAMAKVSPPEDRCHHRGRSEDPARSAGYRRLLQRFPRATQPSAPPVSPPCCRVAAHPTLFPPRLPLTSTAASSPATPRRRRARPSSASLTTPNLQSNTWRTTALSPPPLPTARASRRHLCAPM